MVGSGLEWIKRLEQNMSMGDPADEHQVAMGMFLCISFFFWPWVNVEPMSFLPLSLWSIGLGTV